MSIQGSYITALDSFVGSPSSTDYLPIDNGSATYKINATELAGLLALSVSSVSSLPQTISNSKITADMQAVGCVLSNPLAQTGDWTVTTSAGSAQISGTISGTTDITLYLANIRG